MDGATLVLCVFSLVVIACSIIWAAKKSTPPDSELTWLHSDERDRVRRERVYLSNHANRF
jgi:hypothetical protein